MTFDNTGTTIYGTNDGGVYKTINGAQTWTDVSSGLNVTEYYRFGNAPNSKTELLAGSQDNGVHRYRGGTWFGIFSGDESDALIDPLDSNIVYWSQGPVLLKSLTAGPNYTLVLQDTGDFLCPYIMHPTNNQTIFFGGNHVKKTTNGGATWTTISPIFGPYWITSMAVAKSNPNYIYVASYNGVNLTTNGGATWSSVTNNLPTFFGGFAYISSIAISATNPNHVWVSIPGWFANDKVYESINAGGSWSNVSAGIPNITAHSIVYNNNSLNDEIYLGTDIGVFYKDNSLPSWLPYNTNLPAVKVNELEVHYLTGNLRACTYGRGIWESPLITALPTNVNGNIFSESQIIIYPNPANNFVKIVVDNKNENITGVNIFNLMGQKIIQNDFAGFNLKETELRTENLSKGIYFVEVTTNKSVYSEKIIIAEK